MGHIHLLENDVIDKIAAGEVVERPASVVKELVDNAIDAGASEITVSLKDGGKAYIAVTDDGSGMELDDAKLALTRHATSKISSAADLFSISSRGFRGEALASIASVSSLTLSTRKADKPEGVRLDVTDGKQSERPYSGATGTTVAVSDLFATIPVRKKFLKSGTSEWGHCLDVLQHQALSHPDIAFTVLHNDKEQWRLPRCASTQDGVSVWGEEALRQRARDLFGADKTDPMLYVSSNDRFAKVEGLVSPPGWERGNTKQMYTFVNGRPVKDKTLRYGILRGYHSHLLKGKYPFTILNVTIDPSLVDVNVHPAKTELRFQYAQEVQDLMARSLREVLRDGGWAQPQPYTHQAPASAPSQSRPGMGMSPIGSRPSASPSLGRVSEPSFSRSSPSVQSTWASSPSFFEETAKHCEHPALMGDEALQPPKEAIPWRDLRFVGDFARCYLFFATPGDDRLLVVDQHAFHERILFERLCRDETLLSRQQRLLIPEAVELMPEDVEAIKEQASALQARGFDLRFVSETTVEVHAVPHILSGRDVQSLLEDLADPIDGQESVVSNADQSRLLLATIACHSAVRAGEDLTVDDRKALIAEAETVDFYLNCPHGRRVFRWFDKGQVGRWFDR